MKKAEKDALEIIDAIRKIVRSLRHSSLQAERRHGLSSAQLYILDHLSRSPTPLSVNELAERTLTHQSSVSVVVSKLAARGYLKKSRAKDDFRRVELAITDSGQRALGRNPTPIQDRLVAAIRNLNPTTRRQLAKGFSQLITASGLGPEKATLFFEDKDNHDRQG